MKKLTLLLTLSLSVVTALQAMDMGADLGLGWNGAWRASSTQGFLPASQSFEPQESQDLGSTEFDWRDFLYDPHREMLTALAEKENMTEVRKRKINVPGNDAHEDATEDETQKNKRGRTDPTLNEAELYNAFAALSRDPAGHTTAPAAPIDFTSTTSTATTVSVSTNPSSAEGFASERVVERSEESQVTLMPPAPTTVRQYSQSVQQCYICKCISNLDHAMSSHIGKCNPEEIRKYVCDWDPELCTMRFISPANLTDHMNSHTGEYKCCYCDKDMQSSRKLKDHKKTCEQKNQYKNSSAAADKIITCKKCGQQSNLKIPMRSHKSACNPEINRSYKYVCNIVPDICNMRFVSLGVLNNHKAHHNCEDIVSMPPVRLDDHTTVAIPPVTTPPADQVPMLPVATTTATAHALKCEHKNEEGRGTRRVTDPTLDEELDNALAALLGDLAGHATTSVVRAVAAPIDFTSTASTTTVNSSAERSGFYSAAPAHVVEASQAMLQDPAIQKCPQCKCISNLLHAMKIHIGRCNPEKNKNYKYVCNWNPKLCTMRFRCLDYLEDHMNAHEERRGKRRITDPTLDEAELFKPTTPPLNEEVLQKFFANLG